MSEIDDIPADEEVILTATMDRAFKVLGCDPTCHCCEEEINIGDVFKLACVDNEDEMLCAKCTPEQLIAKQKAAQAEAVQLSLASASYLRSGGFSRPHRGD